jgi:hypothetical protein
MKYTDLRQNDKRYEKQAERKGTAEKIAPKSDSQGAENGTVEHRPLIETPPMARRGNK